MKSERVLWKFEYLIGLSIDGDGETERFSARFRVSPARSPEYRVQPAGPISPMYVKGDRLL